MSDTTEHGLTLRDYGRVLLRRKWLLIVAVVATVGAALAMVLVQEPVYRAEAQMLVRSLPGDSVFSNGSTSAAGAERVIQTEIQLLESDLVVERVMENLQLEGRPPAVSGRSISGTDVVAVRVRSTDPTTAQVMADAYVQAYIDVRREQNVDSLLQAATEVQTKIAELQSQIDVLDQRIAEAPESELATLESQRQVLVSQQAVFKQRLDQLQIDASLETGGAQMVKPASEPRDPIEPQPRQTIPLALLFGLLIGLVAVFVVDYLDDSLRSADELEEITALPVLAVVPIDVPPDHRPISLSRPGDYAVEIYRALRTNIQFLGLDQPVRVVQVTSSLAEEGKTTTSSNLAVVLAQAGQRVLLIDADLRRPRLHDVFGLPRSPGFTSLLLGESFDLVANEVFEGLTVVVAGTVPPNPSEMLSGERIRHLVATLADRYDIVVIDSAPVLPVSDSVALSTSVDGVLVVAQAGRASQKHVLETLERLGRVHARVLGLVLNQASSDRDEDSYGYSYGYAPNAKVSADA